jgi:tyrosinase
MVTRRAVLSSLSLGAAATSSSVVWFDEALAQATRPRRRRMHDLPLNDPIAEAYRDGVRILKERQGNGVSWQSLAAIHGSEQGFNRCPHGNWYFLPWHRAYLVMFEAALRDVTRDASFALPYWDWTTDRALPEHFTSPTYNGQPNALFEPRRFIDAREEIPDEFVGQSLFQQIYDETDFELFGTTRARGQNSTDARWIQARGSSGPLESQAHDSVHGIVGGSREGQSGLMASSLSALDPIFWLHHCNIDRIWAVWNQRGGQNTTNRNWLDMTFANHFLRPNGESYSATVRGLQEILPLGYRYGLGEQEPARPDQGDVVAMAFDTGSQSRTRTFGAPAPAAKFKTDNVRAAEPGRPLEIAVAANRSLVGGALNPPATRTLSRSPGAAPAAVARSGKRVLALINDFQKPAGDTTAVRVFINGDNITAATPVTDPSYVGTFGFFGGKHVGGSGHAGAHGGSSLIVDLTKTLQRLQASGKPLADNIRVQLVPVSVAKGAQPTAVTPGSVEIVVI